MKTGPLDDAAGSAALDPQLVLGAYSIGVFPMADSRDADSVYWVEPTERAILPLDGFHLSHSLRKTLVSDRFRVTANTAFERVIALCAESAEDRSDTWINPQIERASIELHRLGFAQTSGAAGENAVNGAGVQDADHKPITSRSYSTDIRQSPAHPPVSVEE